MRTSTGSFSCYKLIPCTCAQHHGAEPFLQIGVPMAEKKISPAVSKLVDLMEQRYHLPGTDFRFGLDAVIGLVPGFGDFMGMVIGAVVVLEALRLRAPWLVIGRMAVNLWLDAMIGAVPVVGDLWDFWFKANVRNLRLLERHT
jgi:hypothetical protein